MTRAKKQNKSLKAKKNWQHGHNHKITNLQQFKVFVDQHQGLTAIQQVIHARSPQAKGRVERSNRTLQDRLIKDMRLAGICNKEDANIFLQEHYIKKHNELFAYPPTSWLMLID